MPSLGRASFGHYMGMLIPENPAQWAYGCAPKRRREEAIGVQLTASWRLRKAGFVVLRLYDTSDAFPSLAFESIDDMIIENTF